MPHMVLVFVMGPRSAERRCFAPPWTPAFAGDHHSAYCEQSGSGYAATMRSHPTDIISAIVDMLAKFEAVCRDKETLRTLIEIAPDRQRWSQGHALFQAIRQKTLKADREGDELASSQYAFEEICAKTLYNLSGSSAPFDADSAFWVLPLAVDLGRRLGFSDAEQISPLLRV